VWREDGRETRKDSMGKQKGSLESKPSNSFAGSLLELVSTRGKAASGTSKARRKETGLFCPPSRK